MVFRDICRRRKNAAPQAGVAATIVRRAYQLAVRRSLLDAVLLHRLDVELDGGQVFVGDFDRVDDEADELALLERDLVALELDGFGAEFALSQAGP